MIWCSTNLITFNVKSVKYCLFKDACKLGTLFFLSKKTKRKDVIRRAPTLFENFTDQVKRFIQLDPTVFGLSRIDEGTGIIQTHQIMHFITKVAMITSMIAITKVWLRECRSKVQKGKKTEIGKAVCLFCNNKDYKDKLTAAVEYHSGSTNPNTNMMWNH